MKRIKILILTTLLLSSLFGFSQSEKTVLWEVSGNGLESTSYLFGTIHIICPNDLELTPKINTALKNSEQLVLELDMDDPTFMQEMQRLSVNPEMKNLSSSLSDEDLNSLNTFFTKHYGVDMSQLGIMKPLALLSMVVIKGLDCEQTASYEMSLVNYAQQNDWDVIGLETVKEQFEVFENVSQEKQLEWLIDYVTDEGKSKQQLAQLIEAYKQEDILKMLNLMEKQPEFIELANELLYNRNEKWIEKITSIANKKPTFFAFGAAHLGSNRGVVELLKKKGYTVNPIF